MKSVMKLVSVALVFLTTSIWAIVWLPPVDVSVLGQNVSGDPIVAVNPSGDAIAVWNAEITVTNFVIKASVLPFGSLTWSSPVTLSTSANAYDPAAAIDQYGNAIVTWLNPLTNEIEAATYTGGTWTPSVVVGGNGAAGPEVAMYGNGNGIAMWIGFNGIDYIVQASTYTSGSWSAVTNINQLPASAIFGFSFEVDPLGNAVATWLQEYVPTAHYAVYGAIYSGGAWTSSSTLISSTAESADYIQVGVDGEGNALAVWLSNMGGAVSTNQYATLPFGGSWSAAQNIMPPGPNVGGLYVQLAMNSSGDAVAVWIGAASGHFVTQAATYSQGIWSSVAQLSTSSMNAQTPRVSIDGAGDAVAVWQEFISGSQNPIQAATLSFGSSQWTSPVVISTAGLNGSPDVQMDNEGDAVAVWLGFVGGHNIVQASSGFLPVAPPVNGKGRQVKDRFALQSEYYNELEWFPSPSYVAGYRVYRNGVLIAEIPASAIVPINDVRVQEYDGKKMSYRDHLQRKGVPTTYTITAVGFVNIESAPLTIVIQ